MTHLPDIPAGNMGLLLTARPQPRTVSVLTAELTLHGAVQVFDGGNRFRPYTVARQLRRQTADLAVCLARIHVARTFTCYQLLTLFAQTAVTAVPLLALDLLATFSDESVLVPAPVETNHTTVAVPQPAGPGYHQRLPATAAGASLPADLTPRNE